MIIKILIKNNEQNFLEPNLQKTLKLNLRLYKLSKNILKVYLNVKRFLDLHTQSKIFHNMKNKAFKTKSIYSDFFLYKQWARIFQPFIPAITNRLWLFNLTDFIKLNHDQLKIDVKI